LSQRTEVQRGVEEEEGNTRGVKGRTVSSTREEEKKPRILIVPISGSRFKEGERERESNTFEGNINYCNANA
jgi:hypothetical protein